MEDQPAFIKTIQPYFVMGTSRFYQYIFGKYGILHFYNYTVDKNGFVGAVVPNGCVDIVFVYGADGLQAKVYGAVLKYKVIQNELGKTYFGVRFFPGVCPKIIDGKLKEFVGREILLSDATKSGHLLARMSEAHTFVERICTFMKEYKRAILEQQLTSNMEKLFNFMVPMIYETNGKIRIKDIEESMGYSTRYINKIFDEELGMNPKKFCLIIKFQRFLDQLNYGKNEDMAKLGLDFGYYDQSNLIKNFTQYTNMTPGKYYQMIQEFGYNDRVVDVCIK